jgi:MFS family permease
MTPNPAANAAASLRVPDARPTRARHIVMVFIVLLAIITYIDRVCLSQATPDIRRDLSLNEDQMSWVFFVFGMAYALFEIPAGWLGDRNGPRGILMKVVVMWSVFTAATGWAWNYVSMLTFRILFGVGEAGCFPNATKIFTIWLPSGERMRAQSILWLSARWGGAFTPALVAIMMSIMSWRWTFTVFGLVGVVWAIAFYRWFRDRPRDHPSVNAAELAMMDGAESNAPSHQSIPWGKLMASRTVWMLWLQYFCMSYGWYFYVTWLPTYLREARGVSLEKSALLAGLPLFFGGIGSVVGGIIARRLAERWLDVRRARRVTAATGLFSATVMLVLATRISNPALAMVALGMASFSNDLAMAPGWGAVMDVGGRLAGSLSGSFNMMGNFGGAIGPFVVGQILSHFKPAPDQPPTLEGWTLALLVAAGVYAIGGLSWFFIDPVTPLESEEEKKLATA